MDSLWSLMGTEYRKIIDNLVVGRLYQIEAPRRIFDTDSIVEPKTPFMYLGFDENRMALKVLFPEACGLIGFHTTITEALEQ